MKNPLKKDGTITSTVKSFNFVGMKFSCLTMIDMFMDTWIHEFSKSTPKYFIK